MRSDDRAAFTEFFEATYPGVVRCVAMSTGSRDLARDASQEAFARLYPRWRRIRDYDRPDLWVRTVALRVARRASRHRADETPIDDPAAGSHVSSPVDKDLRDAITTLPLGQRTAVILFYFEDLPVAEIARVMECSASTVKVHLHRARTTLARLLKEEADHVS